MHHVIWVEHDGSWTWSIEEGKAFEDDHKVLARHDGFPTRGHAKENMQEAWEKLIKQGKRPGKLADLAKTPRAASAPAKLTAIPEWAVTIDGQLVALFAKQSDAESYATQHESDNHVVHKVSD